MWLPYVEVAEIAEATDRARRAGAAVLLAPREGPAGWRSVVTTPAGGEVALWQPKSEPATSDEFAAQMAVSMFDGIEPMERTDKDIEKVTPETSDRRRWQALYVLCGGMLMIVLDATIVNVALPSIKDDLSFSQSNLAWVVNAYLIAFGGLLLLAGRLGDLIGQRRIFLIGLAVFTAASALCALAQSQGMLIGARFVQGAGGAIASAVILGMIVTMFPEPREQAKAIGVYSFVASAGASIGLLAGGILTEAINWHWIFFVNLPVGAAVALLAVRLVEDRKGIGFAEGADIPGAVLLTSGLMLGVYTLIEAGEQGFGSSTVLVLGAISIALLVTFVARQARIATPLMPLRLFRSRNVTGANLVMAPDGRRLLQHVLPGRSLPSGNPRLQPARGGLCLPACMRRDGNAVTWLRGAPDHGSRCTQDADRGPRVRRRGFAPVRALARRRQLT